MRTCDLGFDHEDPEPIIVEEAVDVEPVAEATVEVARIEADRDVAVAKIERGVIDEEVAARIAALEAENETLRGQLAPPEEEQQQAVVVVSDPEPEPEPAAEAEPPAVESGEPANEAVSKKRSNPWW